MSVRMGVSGSGYSFVADRDSGEWVYVHRLVALADHDTETVAACDVHHRDGVVENNSRENLTPIRRAEHADLTLNGDD